MGKVYEKANDQHVGIINLYFSMNNSHPSGNGNNGYCTDEHLTIRPDMKDVLECLKRGVQVRLVQMDGDYMNNNFVPVLAMSYNPAQNYFSFSAMGATAGNVNKDGSAWRQS